MYRMVAIRVWLVCEAHRMILLCATDDNVDDDATMNTGKKITLY